MSNLGQEAKNRFAIIRLRTIVSTLAIIVTLVFYFLVNIGKAESFDIIEFSMVSIVQLIVYYIYFPDGDLFGQQDSIFIINRESYNDKATKINENGLMNKLREYCKYDFEVRKERYINNNLGYIGITKDEFEILKQKDEKFIKNLKSYEFKNEDKSKLIFFNKPKRKLLYKLIFKRIPIEENQPETILSATENNGSTCIKDGSNNYKKNTFISKFLKVVMIGGILAYTAYTTKNGIGFAEIAQILTYLTAIITNAVTSFNAGEKCSKVYKNQFYLELANFIDEFNEYLKKEG